MNPLIGRKAWLVAPVCFVISLAILVALWWALEPETVMVLFDQDGAAPVELMTLALFALIVPLVWLCPPVGGSARKQAFWSAEWSLLAVMAIVRETDLHKTLFDDLWPEIAAGFKGTVFKMRFLTAWDMPVMPRLFVLFFFILFFAAVMLPLARYLIPLAKGFFTLKPVAWSAAVFGGTSVLVLVCDRLPAWYRHAHDGTALSDAARAFCAVLEEGGEMMMALFALLALLQSYVVFNVLDKKED